MAERQVWALRRSGGHRIPWRSDRRGGGPTESPGTTVGSEVNWGMTAWHWVRSFGSSGWTAGTGSPGIRSFGSTAGTASSGKTVGSESTGTTVSTGSSGTGLSGSTAGIRVTRYDSGH
ncbi:unnamed protein product, partial [Staurois parvus]